MADEIETKDEAPAAPTVPEAPAPGEDSRVMGQENIANIYTKQARESEKQAEIIKNMLMDR